LNSTIKNAPNIVGLSPECAKIVWYNLALQNPYPAGAIKFYDADSLVVTFKQHVSKDKAREIIYSPEANGTFFLEDEDDMWENLGAVKAYVGRWNYTQMCYFEHLPEVRIDCMLRNSTDISPGFSCGTNSCKSWILWSWFAW
jgi:hypothetical protein